MIAIEMMAAAAAFAFFSLGLLCLVVAWEIWNRV